MMTMEQELDLLRCRIIRDLFAIRTEESLNSISRSVKRAIKREETECNSKLPKEMDESSHKI